jgi:hypothetical protein
VVGWFAVNNLVDFPLAIALPMMRLTFASMISLPLVFHGRLEYLLLSVLYMFFVEGGAS